MREMRGRWERDERDERNQKSTNIFKKKFEQNLGKAKKL